MQQSSKISWCLACMFIALLFIVACKQSTSPSDPDLDENSGGQFTVRDNSSFAFGTPAACLAADHAGQFADGDQLFSQKFVASPAPVFQGLGPLYNNISCSSCHVKDGRGRPPFVGENFNSMLFRVSIDGSDASGGPVPVPGFGLQLQNRATVGFEPEGSIDITYHDSTVYFDDGSKVVLQVPTYGFGSTYISLPSGVRISPRVAPQNFGLGLLEAIAETDLLKSEDENDANGDGISGRVNRVFDHKTGKMVVGRFGLKANVGSLQDQIAGAFNGDMGITTTTFADENCKGQVQSPPAHDPEVNDAALAKLLVYLRGLAVPARRNVSDVSVRRGQTVFTQIGCASCHTPTQKTSDFPEFPELSNQTIHPYTDLLLHDMGAGLSDGRTDWKASAAEWRTPPLWGIGLTAIVNNHSNYLHDGRARNIQEAILWHGGEAQKSVQSFLKLGLNDRSSLLSFLSSL